MIEKEQNFFEFVYDVFYKFAQTKPEDVSLTFSRKTQYPTMEFTPELQITIPLPKKQQDGRYVFEGMVFEDSENGRRDLWCLFLATIYHMAAHAGASTYHIYEQWRKNKTHDVCYRVIDFIEDVTVEKYISHANPEIWENIKNISSKLILSQTNQDGKHQKIVHRKKRDSKPYDFHDNQKTIEKIKNEIIEKRGGDDHKEKMLSFANLLYKNRELLPKTVLPYCEHREYEQIIKTEKMGVEFEPHGELFEENIVKLDELWGMDERSKNKILRTYKKYLKDLKFDMIVIPPGNLHSFAQIKTKTLPMLRRIRQQIRMIANLTDDPKIDEIGYVDMQMAIQAVASEGQTQSIFERDELRRGEEAWVILVDKSASMNLRFDQIKEFTVCLSESANELTGKTDGWALYSFDNNFQILKDFKEKYNKEVQARIGGIENSGLSLLPDAIQLATRILDADPRERKYLFVITDGHPSGYERIQEQFSKVVKKTEVSGITLVAIGVSKAITGRFRNSAKGHDLKGLVAKFITAYRAVATSDV
ncbi:MAG TPA: vWA domain-containing protein [Nitrosopumilaceae archaeon]|nr:vWA domain-containing protein [Nitrosopumilaceae archaeon]